MLKYPAGLEVAEVSSRVRGIKFCVFIYIHTLCRGARSEVSDKSVHLQWSSEHSQLIDAINTLDKSICENRQTAAILV